MTALPPDKPNTCPWNAPDTPVVQRSCEYDIMLGAIALAGGALVFTVWLMFCVEVDSLIFLLVLSEVELLTLLLKLVLVLSVVTLDSEVDSL